MGDKKIAIIGAGVMGCGIAQVASQYDFDVTIFSRRGVECFASVRKGIENSVKNGRLSQTKAKIMLSNIKCERLSFYSTIDADILIEAVEEDLSAKTALFKQLDMCCPSDTIFASNTSSLSITTLALATKRPGQVVGMHFFNPAPIMSLVEVCRTPLTSSSTVNRIVDLSTHLEKYPLVVQDSPGFLVNKILMPMINAAAYVLMSKVASAEMVDSAMKFGANHPIGPLALADLIGLDVCLKIMKEINGKVEGMTFTICPLIEQLAANGHLGRKSGQGFYMYNGGKEECQQVPKKLVVTG